MRFPISVLSALFIVCTLFITSVFASWAYSFVVNDGSVYVTTTDHVDQKQIGSRIGKVTKYSTQEGTYSGNFSNQYPKGTEYYEITGIDIEEKTENKHKGLGFSPYVFAALFILIAGYFIKKKMNR